MHIYLKRLKRLTLNLQTPNPRKLLLWDRIKDIRKIDAFGAGTHTIPTNRLHQIKWFQLPLLPFNPCASNKALKILIIALKKSEMSCSSSPSVLAVYDLRSCQSVNVWIQTMAK